MVLMIQLSRVGLSLAVAVAIVVSEFRSLVRECKMRIALPFQFNDKRQDRVFAAYGSQSLYLYISCMTESRQLQACITDAASNIQGQRIVDSGGLADGNSSGLSWQRVAE